MQATVFLPITRSGFFAATGGRRAAFSKSASPEISMPGAITPHR